MKVIGYARCSTEKQDLFRQKTQIRSFCKNKGMELVRIIEDKVSGISNFASLEIIQELTTEDCDVIVVSEQSRLTRNADALYLLNLINTIIHNGIKVIFLNRENTIYEHELDILDIVMLSVESNFAATERERITSRMSSGKMTKLARWSSMSTGKSHPYGYMSVPNPEYIPAVSPRAFIVPDPEKAEHVKEMFEMVARGERVADVARYANRVWFDKEVSQVQIARMLRNPAYKGERTYAGVKCEIEPIVSKDLWNTVNHIMEGRKSKRTTCWKNDNPLFGLTFCMECGEPMWQMQGHGYFYLSCKKNMKGKKKCPNLTFNLNMTTDIVEEIIQRTLTEDEYAKATGDARKEQDRRIAVREKQIVKLEKEIERLKRKSSLLSDRLDVPGVSELFDETMNDIQQTKAKIAETKLEIVELSKPKVVEKKKKDELQIRDVVERIELGMVDGEKTARVFFRNGIVRDGVMHGRYRKDNFIFVLDEEE